MVVKVAIFFYLNVLEFDKLFLNDVNFVFCVIPQSII